MNQLYGLIGIVNIANNTLLTSFRYDESDNGRDKAIAQATLAMEQWQRVQSHVPRELAIKEVRRVGQKSERWEYCVTHISSHGYKIKLAGS